MTAFAESVKESSESTGRDDCVKGDNTHSTNCDNSLEKSEPDKDQIMKKTCDDSKYTRPPRKCNSRDQMKKKTNTSNSDFEEHMYDNCDQVSDDDRLLIKYAVRTKPKTDSSTMTNGDNTEGNFGSEESVDGSLVERKKIKVHKLSRQKNSHLKHKKNIKKKHMGKKSINNKLAKLKPIKQSEDKQPQDKIEEDESLYKACPICNMMFPDTHSFTLHIREHNTNKQSHVCQICSRKLSSASSLDRHMYVHSGERPFKCTICDIAFTTNGNMHRHMRTHNMKSSQLKESKGDCSTNVNHSKELAGVKRKLFTPSSTNTTSESENEPSAPKKAALEMNTDENFNENLACPVCGKQNLDITSMQSHMKSHPNDPIMCRKCNLVTENYLHYTEHVCSEIEKALNDKPTIGFRDLNFIEFSSKKFSLIAKNVCENVTRYPSSTYLAYECRICSKAFPCSRTLHCHETVHDNEIGTYCHSCKCNFSSSKCLQHHQLKHRSAEQCKKENEERKDQDNMESKKEDFLALLELRNKVISISPKLENVNEYKEMEQADMEHLDDLKSEQKPKQDSQSEASNDFADITSIISLTSKTFIPNIRASPLTAAPASPPQDTIGPMPNSPVIEGSANSTMELQSPTVTTPTEIDLESHKSDLSCSEEGFSCNECDAQFSNMNTLKRHKRTHGAGGQPYKCKTCSYQSVDRSTLMRHFRTHNGERPFKCSICDYAFTTKANSHRHVKKKHKLPDNEVADAVVYNPNMLESSVSENIPSDINSTETVCKYCNHDFKYNRVLRHHLRSLNNSCSRKPYACRNCKLGFSTKNNCIRHISNQHPEFKDKLKELIVVNGIVENTEAEQQQQDMQEENPDEDGDEKMETSDVDEHEQPLNLKLSNSKCSSPNPEAMEIIDMDDADRVSAAQSLVSLSELLPPQDDPLDLSLHALDLTARVNSLTPSKHEKAELKEPQISPQQTSPLKLAVEVNILPSKHTLPPVVPLPISSFSSTSAVNLSRAVAKPKNGMTPTSCKPNENKLKLHATLPLKYLSKPINSVKAILPKTSPVNLYLCSTVNSINIPVKSIESENNVKINQIESKSDNDKLPQNPRPYHCNYCSSGFTLKSNKERHIKKKHPEHARPTRSRNFIPTLSSSEVSKQTSTLSDKTRDALRVVLSTKVNIGGGRFPLEANDMISDQVIEQSSPQCIDVLPSAKEDPLPQSAENPNNILAELDIKSDNENADLASVSSVINTANSQAFKQYLNGAKDVDSSEKEDTDVNLQVWNCNSDSEEDASTSPDSKFPKKSSYSKSKKNVPCNYCENSFPWQSSLQRHVLTHTGHKPHKCPKCPVRFTTKSNRDRHLYRKHSSSSKNSIEKSFKCKLFPSSCFSKRNTLKKHSLKHITKTVSKSSNKESRNELTENLDVDDSIKDEVNSVSSYIKQSDSNVSEDLSHKKDNDYLSLPKELLVSKQTSQDNAVLKDCVDSLSLCITETVVHNTVEKSNGYVDLNDNAVILNTTVMCCFCSETINTNVLHDHTRMHSAQSKVNCKICCQDFTDALGIQNHQQFHLKQTSTLNKKNDTNIKKIASVRPVYPTMDPSSLLFLIATVDKIPNTGKSKVTAPIKDNLPVPNGHTETTDNQEIDNDSNLIMDLLGVEDPQLIDDMIDNAARTRIQNCTE